MKKISRQRGFMQIVILAIVVIAALSYFNIDLRTIVASPVFQKFWNIFVVAWVTYIKPLLMYLWTAISTGLSIKQ